MFGLNIGSAAIWLLSVAAIFSAGAAVDHHFSQKKYDILLTESARFKGGVETAGREARLRVESQTRLDLQRKKETDAKDKARATADAATVARLRAERDAARSAGGGVVPASPAGSVCPPEWACYAREDLGAALRGLTSEVRGLADESAKVERELGTAREWAAERGSRETNR